MKRYLSTHLPGDVALTHDGSIGLIVKVQIITTRSRHVEWNFLYGGNALKEGESVGVERYALDAIPGYSISKLAWWTLPDFKQVLHGPLHQVLSGQANTLLRLDAGRDEKILEGGDAPCSIPKRDGLTVTETKEQIGSAAATSNPERAAGPGGLSSVAPFGRPWYKK